MGFVTIRLRRGQSAEWTKYNPKLDYGEPGFELDTGKLKIGDGKTKWNNLGYTTDINGGVVNAPSKSDFPPIGKENIIYKADVEKKIYQWNAQSSVYEEISPADLTHLKRVILESVDQLPPLEEADYSTIYMVPRVTRRLEIKDVYVEYMLIDDHWEIIGDTSVDLSNYATIAYVDKTNETLTLTINEKAKELQLQINTKASQADVKKVTQRVAENEELDTQQEHRLAILEGIGSEKNIINAVSNEFNVSSDRVLSVNTINSSKINGLADLLNTKVDKTPGQRLITDDEANRLAHIIVEGQRVKFDGIVEADNVSNLSTWISTNRNTTDGLVSETQEIKLNNIEDGAQVNTVEAVSIEGSSTPLPNVEKMVIIPLATDQCAGVVRLSQYIGLDEEGELTVKSVNVNALTQTPGDSLVLDGGFSASKE